MALRRLVLVKPKEWRAVDGTLCLVWLTKWRDSGEEGPLVYTAGAVPTSEAGEAAAEEWASAALEEAGEVPPRVQQQTTLSGETPLEHPERAQSFLRAVLRALLACAREQGERSSRARSLLQLATTDFSAVQSEASAGAYLVLLLEAAAADGLDRQEAMRVARSLRDAHRLEG